jgi:hypothetical protein
MKKTFDAVAFQRKIRERLSQQYAANREQFVRELRRKYGHRRPQGANQC